MMIELTHDELNRGNELYYRIILTPDGSQLKVAEMQWFDEFDYSDWQLVDERRFTDREEAERELAIIKGEVAALFAVAGALAGRLEVGEE